SCCCWSFNVSRSIEKRIALWKLICLAGGRGTDGAPIITFPEYPGFSEIPDEDFLNVVTYLTSIPSLEAASIGFIIIIDRRRDKWSAVKASLTRIAGAFPGNLQLVFVLRPSRFIQRAIADIGIKLYRDDFKMKVPIIMLNSVSDLHGYIDKSQLTRELGGTLEYGHSQWIHHRTAIENFAMTVKTTAQMLQTFGTNLAETELPNDVPCTEELLSSHTEQHNKLKVSVCVSLSLTLRKIVLGNIQGSLVSLFICSTFLCTFFLKVKLVLDNLMEAQAGFTDIGDSVSRVEHLLKEGKQIEERGQEPLEKAQTLALQGDQLIQNNHYAIDSIRPKCVELRRICDDFANETKKIYDILGKSLELHKQIDKASQWCEAGIYLLASQAVDKCQTQEGAETALCDIEKFLGTAKEHQLLNGKEFCNHNAQRVLQKLEDVQEMFDKRQVSLKKLAAKPTRPVQPVAPHPESSPKRASPKSIRPTSTLGNHIINELIETERVYVEELQSILEGYASEMDNPDLIHLIPTAVLNRREVLFGNLSEIYEFHNRFNLLTTYFDFLKTFISFMLQKEDLQIYEKYCQNKPRSEALWRQCGDSLFFQECQRKLDHKLSLDAYLLKPVQRITKYQLLLKEMLKCSKNSEGTAELEEALATVLDIIKSANDSMHQIAITGYEGDVHELGKLLLQGSFNVWTDHKKGHNKVKDLARFKPMQRHLFLYAKILLFCKKREENTDGHEKSPSYSFKNSLKMSTVGITENVKGDNKKFEIWYNGREEVYIIQAASVELKNTWVSEIRKVLTGQLEACRVASSIAAAAQSFSRLRLFVTSWTSPGQSSLSAVTAPSSFKVNPVTSRIPSIHLALGWPLFLFPSIFPSIMIFSKLSCLLMMWPKYFSHIISCIISWRMAWLDLLAVQGTLRIFLQHQSSKSIYLPSLSLPYGPALASICYYGEYHCFDYADLRCQCDVSALHYFVKVGHCSPPKK
uniref:MCF.2 cell line derived transforming sequence-like 2 n=1 Tax=Anolis carolinensis TaxID=28377 RepID=A0A803SUR9_ANOCA